MAGKGELPKPSYDAKKYSDGRPTITYPKHQHLLASDAATGTAHNDIKVAEKEELQKASYDPNQNFNLGRRPSYPTHLFHFIASKTPEHHLAWDVGTGTGQVIPHLAELYTNVVGTDISQTQLESAPKLTNVRYYVTPPGFTVSDLEQAVGPQSTIDLIIVANAIHWLDLPKFYDLVRHALKKPNGVIAAWCYTAPKVNDEVDNVFWPFYKGFDGPGWAETTGAVDDKYKSIDFPFELIDGLDHTGPFEFESKKEMSVDDYLTFIRSWTVYKDAKKKGVEMLPDGQVEKFKRAWRSGHGKDEKVVRFPIYLRIGKVGDIS